MSTYTAGGKPLSLGTQLGGRGGEGFAYLVTGRQNDVAKIYHETPTPSTVAKIKHMIGHPPAGAQAAQGRSALAWPTELVQNTSGQVAGFLMPLVDMADAAILYTVIDPVIRAGFTTTGGKPFTWRHLHEIARNLTRIVQRCHEAGYVIGDLNTKNTIVHRDGTVTLIDNDSFQVTTPLAVYRSEVIWAPFAPPELLGVDLKTVDRQPHHDNHILAVLIFHLLQDGRHPFLGACPKDKDPPEPLELVRRGWYPYDLTRPESRVRPHPLMSPLARLHPEVVRLLQRCFGDGLGTPALRPTAQEWTDALDSAIGSIQRCARNHEFVSTNHGVCLALGSNGRYCGSTASAMALKTIPLDKVDVLTGAGAREFNPLPFVTLEVEFRSASGQDIPAGTRVKVYSGTVAAGITVRSRNLPAAVAAGHIISFGNLSPGSYLVRVEPPGHAAVETTAALGSAPVTRVTSTLGAARHAPTAPRPQAINPPVKPVKPIVLPSQQLALLRVVIRGSPRYPLARGSAVSIEARDRSGATVARTTTVSTGDSVECFLSMPLGEHVIVAVADNRAPWTRPVTLTSKPPAMHIALQPLGAAVAVVRLDFAAGKSVPPGATYEIQDATGVVVASGTVPASGEVAFTGAPGEHTFQATISGQPPILETFHPRFSGKETFTFASRPSRSARLRKYWAVVGGATTVLALTVLLASPLVPFSVPGLGQAGDGTTIPSLLPVTSVTQTETIDSATNETVGSEDSVAPTEPATTEGEPTLDQRPPTQMQPPTEVAARIGPMSTQAAAIRTSIAPTATRAATEAPTRWVMIANTGGEGAYVNRVPGLYAPIRAYSDGTRLEVMNTDSEWADNLEWIQVRTPDGEIGWIATILTVPADTD